MRITVTLSHAVLISLSHSVILCHCNHVSASQRRKKGLAHCKNVWRARWNLGRLLSLNEGQPRAINVAYSILGIVFHLLLYPCEDRSPVIVAWITLCKLIVVIPCYHTRRVCDDGSLLVRKCPCVQKELRPCTLWIGLERRFVGDQ
jgi:hypothetical protein